MIAFKDEQPKRRHGENWRQPDPGPLFIWAACKRIQQTWTEEERIARRDGVAGGQPRKKKK